MTVSTRDLVARAHAAIEGGRLDEARSVLIDAIWQMTSHDAETIRLARDYHESRGEKDLAETALHAANRWLAAKIPAGPPPADITERFAKWLRRWLEPKWRLESMTLDEISLWVGWFEDLEHPAALADWDTAAQKRRELLVEHLPLTRLERAIAKKSKVNVEAIARELIATRTPGPELSHAAAQIQTISPAAALSVYEHILSMVDLPPHWQSVTANNMLCACAMDETLLAHAPRLIDKALPFASGNPSIYYNVACLHARRGDRANALANIALALKHGFENPAQLHDDGDFASYVGNPDFEVLFKR